MEFALLLSRFFKSLLKAVFLSSLLLWGFHAFAPESVFSSRSSRNSKKDIIFKVTYSLSDYIEFRMFEVKEAMEKRWGKKFYKIPLRKIKDRAKKGNQISREFLFYFYLDKMLENDYFKYNSYFRKMKVDFQEVQDIWNFLRDYERSFITGFLKAISLSRKFQRSVAWESDNGLDLLYDLKDALVALSKADKEKASKEFKFLWAFLAMEIPLVPQVNYFEGRLVKKIHDLVLKLRPKARQLILQLAQENYAPAQYFHGLIDVKEQHYTSAVHWFQKSYDRNYQRENSLYILSHYYTEVEKDPIEARPLLEELIYRYGNDFLRPKLLDIYFEIGKSPEFIFSFMKQTAENYTKIHNVPESLSIMALVSLFLLEGYGVKKDLDESFAWWKRARFLAENNDLNINLILEPGLLNVGNIMERRFSPERIQAVEHRAFLLHRAGTEFSDMGIEMTDSGTCLQEFSIN